MKGKSIKKSRCQQSSVVLTASYCKDFHALLSALTWTYLVEKDILIY